MLVISEYRFRKRHETLQYLCMFSAFPGKSGKIREGVKRESVPLISSNPKVPFYSLPLYLPIINQSHSQSRFVTRGLRFPSDSFCPHTRQKIGRSTKYQGITTTGTLQAIPAPKGEWDTSFMSGSAESLHCSGREEDLDDVHKYLNKQINTKLKYLWLLWKLAQWSSRAGSRKVLQTTTEMSWEEILLPQSEGL